MTLCLLVSVRIAIKCPSSKSAEIGLSFLTLTFQVINDANIFLEIVTCIFVLLISVCSTSILTFFSVRFDSLLGITFLHFFLVISLLKMAPKPSSKVPFSVP